MKLGSRVQISMGVKDVEKSAEFFRKLNFELVDEKRKPYPWKQFTDGTNLFLLNQDGMEYVGLVYYNPKLTKTVKKLEAKKVSFFWKQEADAGESAEEEPTQLPMTMAMFIDPTGVHGKNGPRNVGINMVHGDPGEELHLPDGEPVTLCGKFGELAVPTLEYNKAKKFYLAKLGFKLLYEKAEGRKWCLVSDGLVVLGLHDQSGFGEDERFYRPAPTYFSLDSAERIVALKAKGLTTFFEHTNEAGEATLAGFKSPDGVHFYVFHGEI